MKIAVRLDDITPDMDWERFLRFKALLDRYQVKPLIGVVPDNQDENLQAHEKNQQLAKENPLVKSMLGPERKTAFARYVKKLQEDGFCIAMHGYRHIYETEQGGLFPLNNFSEFAGLSLEEQTEKLLAGKRLLEEWGIVTDLFMAPAHSYDRNTLKALQNLGFQRMTDGFGDGPYKWKGMTFYPISFQLSRTFQKKKGFSTMVVHTGTVSDEDLRRYEKYFQNPAVEWISYEEYLKQPAKERSFLGRGREFFMAKGKCLVSAVKNR